MDTRKSSHVFFYFLLGFGLSITALNSVHKKLENRVFTYQDVLVSKNLMHEWMDKPGWMNGKLEDEPEAGVEHADLIFAVKIMFRRKLGPKGVARMYPVLLDVLRETHSLTYSVPPQRERSRPGRLLDTLIRRSRGQSKQSTEETKPVHSRDDHELLRGALKRMSSPQNITDMCNQIFKDLEKDKRQSTRPSSKATDPRNCSKQEQIIQELKREPSNKVSK
ncbi:hypothetical protein HID58_074438 [Brassica napus]|uniref:Uncharacterized protein n=1 Tax=Brassica napus TaxID=3708 RepID=A0ABQ7YJU4_BRANA|nr:hypothetical protein HID58_074438 [Brassica napus]